MDKQNKNAFLHEYIAQIRPCQTQATINSHVKICLHLVSVAPADGPKLI